MKKASNIVKLRGGNYIERHKHGKDEVFIKKNPDGSFLNPSSKPEFFRHKNGRSSILPKAKDGKELYQSEYEKALKFTAGLMKKAPKPKKMAYAAYIHSADSFRHDISDLVGPYTINSAQKRLLSYVIGKKQLDDMVLMNTLSHLGYIRSTCPSLGDSTKTETYVDPITGMVQCRRPFMQRKVAEGPKKCPQDSDDPLALELYVSKDGKSYCSRPVVRGDFQCPNGDINKTKRIVLGDGTGVCVAPPKSILERPDFFPSHIWYPSVDINGMTDIARSYYSSLQNLKLNEQQAQLMFNTLSTMDKHISDKLVDNPDVIAIREMFPEPFYPKDLGRMKYAFSTWLRNEHPHISQDVFPDIGAYMNFMGVRHTN